MFIADFEATRALRSTNSHVERLILEHDASASISQSVPRQPYAQMQLSPLEEMWPFSQLRMCRAEIVKTRRLHMCEIVSTLKSRGISSMCQAVARRRELRERFSTHTVVSFIHKVPIQKTAWTDIDRLVDW